MGEAKRKAERLKLSACRCQSDRPAGQCCFNGRRWRKLAASLGLRRLPPGDSLPRCYMQELASCEPPISGEHLFSKAVMEVLKGDGDLSVTGMPWQDTDEEKIIGLNSLRANCLCRRHNSALSPLDDAAARFIAALRKSMEGDTTPEVLLFSGHDIERWLLKTLKALAVSGNLASGREKLPGAFERNIDVIKLLDDYTAWPEATGLYFIMPTDSRMRNDKRFKIQPRYDDAQKEIVGLWTSFVGIEFVMMIAAPDINKSRELRRSLYRPGRLEFSIDAFRKLIELSWDDGRVHDSLNVTFERLVQS
jgi:hypothetical protein